jgi:hypothetical protein
VTWNVVDADVRPIVLACLHIPVFDLRKNKELDLFGLNAELESGPQTTKKDGVARPLTYVPYMRIAGLPAAS